MAMLNKVREAEGLRGREGQGCTDVPQPKGMVCNVCAGNRVSFCVREW